MCLNQKDLLLYFKSFYVLKDEVHTAFHDDEYVLNLNVCTRIHKGFGSHIS